MYSIIKELKAMNVTGALNWARNNRDALNKKGSTLEFQIVKLEYIQRLTAISQPRNLPYTNIECVQYARKHFKHFGARHIKGISLILQRNQAVNVRTPLPLQKNLAL